MAFFRIYNSDDRKFYKIIRSILDLKPGNIDVYKLALIHRSASVPLPDGTMANNERLEFLGDAVLEAVISDFLFLEYTDQSEGFLTQIRSRIVNRITMDEAARSIGLDHHIISNFNGSHSNRHFCGNALEALIGAIYLDKGYEFTKSYVTGKILPRHFGLEHLLLNDSDSKSRLIEWCQKSKREIRFRTTHDDESTTHHPRFVSTITIDGINMGCATGTSKKEAEQSAAHAVMQIVGDEVGDLFLESIDRSAEQAI